MKGLFALQDKYRVNLRAMLDWAFEFEDKQYFEGFRTLATNGIDKPVLNVFRMAGLMSGQRVETTSSAAAPLESILANGVRPLTDVDALATRSDRSVEVMLWNYQDDDLPASPAQVQLTIAGLPATVRRVLVQHDRIDHDHSNAYTAWQVMGSPQQPTPAQLDQLRAAGQLQALTSPVWIDVANGRITLPVSLPSQATSLLRLNW
jgi:xylan 1,4-beta-xylosidase